MFALLLIFQILAISAQLETSCRTTGREAVLKGLAEVGKSRKWGRCSEKGVWEEVPPPDLQSNTTTPSQAQTDVSTCCEASCRAKVVPKDQLGKAPFSSIVQLELITRNFVVRCTGTMVAPKVVLTSSYCFADSDSEPILGGVVKGWYTEPGVPAVTVSIRRWRFFENCDNYGSPSYAAVVLAWNPKIPILPFASNFTSTEERKISSIGFFSVPGVPPGQMVVHSVYRKDISTSFPAHFSLPLASATDSVGSVVHSEGGAGFSGLVGFLFFTYFPGESNCLADRVLSLGSLVSSAIYSVPYSVPELVRSVF